MKRIGIDISSFQGQPNFAEVAPHVHFLIHRSWMGDAGITGEVDPTFTAERVKELRHHGIVFGPYCFAKNAGNSGKMECRRFLNHAHAMGWGKKGDLPGTLDIETGSGKRPGTKFVREFAREYRKMTHHRGFLYTGSFWRDVLGNPMVLGRWKLYLAAYTPTWHGWVPRAWKKPYIWQFTDHLEVPGIQGGVDGDRWLRSARAFHRTRLKRDLHLSH